MSTHLPASVSATAPCIVYATVGAASNVFVIHYHSSVNYETPVIYFDAQSRNTPAQYLFSLNSSQIVKHKMDLEIDRYVYYGYIDLRDPTYAPIFATAQDLFFQAGGVMTDNATDYLSPRKIMKMLPTTGPVKFVTGGDIGTTSAADSVSAVAASYNPYFAVIGGDISYENNFRSCYGRWDKFFLNWQNQMTADARITPFITAIGNHESGGFGFELSKVNFYPYYFVHANPVGVDNLLDIPTYHAHHISDTVTIVALDSGVNLSPASQVDFLTKTLDEPNPHAATFAVYHAPLYPSVRPFDNVDSALVRESWEKVFGE